MIGGVTVANQRAEAQAPVGQRLDKRQRQLADVDHTARTLDASLHQVEEIGSSAEIVRPGLRTQLHGVCDIPGFAELKDLHG
jgi:hypothetical protein